MVAKYHIITDIECKILHFGTEIGIACPGKDSFILLMKGKHLLSFVSTENPLDKYEIVFVVPENDIEDFIEVQLVPYRDARLIREEEKRQQAIEEEQKRLEEQRQREEAEMERIEYEKQRIQEEKKRQEEERRKADEQVKRCEQEIEGVNTYLSHLLNNEQLEVSETPVPINVYINKFSGETTLKSPKFDRINEFDFRTQYAIVRKIKYERAFIWTKEVTKWCGEPYYQAGPFCFNRAFVNNSECIDENFSRVFCLDPRVTYSSYKLGVGFLARSIADKGRNPSKRDIILSIIDLNGNILFTKDLQTITEVFEPLSCFPFIITTEKSSDAFGNFRNIIVIKYKTNNVLYQTYRQLCTFNKDWLSVPIDQALPSKSIMKKSNIDTVGLSEVRSKVHQLIGGIARQEIK